MQRWLLFLSFIFASGLLAACNSRAYLPNFSVPPSPTPHTDFFNLDSILPSEFLSQASLSADGTLLVALGSASEVSSINQLLVVDLTTKSMVYSGTEELWISTALSPDGLQIAACGYLSSEQGIYLVDWKSQSTAYLTDGCWPAWSPDMQNLAYVHYTTETGPNRRAQIRVYEPSTRNEHILYDVLSPHGFIVDLVWSQDGSKLAFTAATELVFDDNGEVKGNSNVPRLYTIDADGNNLQRLTDESQHVVSPNFSPDSSKVLYVDWSAPLSAYSKYVQVIDLDGNCHRLTVPVSEVYRVTLSPKGDTIIFETVYGLLLAETEKALGEDFWTTGNRCTLFP